MKRKYVFGWNNIKFHTCNLTSEFSNFNLSRTGHCHVRDTFDASVFVYSFRKVHGSILLFQNKARGNTLLGQQSQFQPLEHVENNQRLITVTYGTFTTHRLKFSQFNPNFSGNSVISARFILLIQNYTQPVGKYDLFEQIWLKGKQ